MMPNKLTPLEKGTNPMNRILLAAFVVAVIAVSLGAAYSSQHPTPAQMVAAADTLDKAFLAAFNKGDADALTALYWDSPDVVQFPPDTLQVRGMTALKAANRSMMTNFKGAKLELTEAHQMPAGDVVIGWGLWRITMPGPDGKPTTMVGRYTDIKAQHNGKWVIIHDHASAPLPPPPAP